MPSFRLVGLDHLQFQPWFDLDDRELAARGAVRTIANADRGFPCRVSLEDARSGDELLLLSHLHQPADSPYRSSGPIFVRRGVVTPQLAPGMVPEYVTRRLISLRVYDAKHMMIEAGVHEGTVIADQLASTFANPEVAYVQLHNAARGCFSCHVERVFSA